MTRNLVGCMVTILLTLTCSSALADRIAIIGTGNVGAALGPEFAALGHDIVYGSRDPTRADVRALVQRTGGDASATTQRESVIGADMVVLAVREFWPNQLPGTWATCPAKSLLTPLTTTAVTAKRHAWPEKRPMPS